MNGAITLTMTTCKRYTLFEQTFHSLLENCQDFDKVEKVVCVDDNSSDEDREKMFRDFKTVFPYERIKLLYKHPCDRGLGQSMNRIFDEVDTRFIFHVEDDWEFVKKGNCITEALDVIENTENIKSTLVRSYNFLPKLHTTTGNPYHILEIDAKVDHGDGVWRHGYSLNPSVQDLDAIKEKGLRFPHNQVEYAFGLHYYNHGFRAATLTTEYVKHIGENASAFDLNWTPR